MRVSVKRCDGSGPGESGEVCGLKCGCNKSEGGGSVSGSSEGEVEDGWEGLKGMYVGTT